MPPGNRVTPIEGDITDTAVAPKKCPRSSYDLSFGTRPFHGAKCL